MPDISGVCSVFGTFEITTKPMKPASTRIARLVVSTLASIRPPPPRRPRAVVDDLAVLHDARSLHDLVLPVERQRAVLADEQLEQRLDVAGEQLRGVLGHARGQVQRRDDLDVVPDDGLARLGQLGVAARLAREVDDHRARLHPFDRLGGDEPRRGAAGHERGRDHDVEALDRVGQRLLLAARSSSVSSRA